MINAIKMDLYRLFHAKSLWIMLLVTIAVSVFMVTMTNFDIQLMKEDQNAFSDTVVGTEISEEGITMSFGFYTETNPQWIEGKIDFSDFFSTQLASGMFLAVCAIFASNFVGAERKHGFLKNIAGQMSGRWILVFSKFVAIAVQILCMFIVAIITMFVAGKVVWGEQFVLGSLASILQAFGGQYLLHIGFASFIIGLCIVFNSELSMVIGVLITCRVATLLYVAIDNFLDVDISKYMIEMNISTFSLDMSQSDWIRNIIVVMTYIIISFGLASLVMQKRDIK